MKPVLSTDTEEKTEEFNFNWERMILALAIINYLFLMIKNMKL